MSKRTGLPPIPPVGVTAGPVNDAVALPDAVELPDSVALLEMEAEELPLTDSDALPEMEEADAEPVIDTELDAEETDE